MIDCIITGSGVEYGGSRSFSASNKKCKSWNRKLKLKNNVKVRKLAFTLHILLKSMHVT